MGAPDMEWSGVGWGVVLIYLLIFNFSSLYADFQFQWIVIHQKGYLDVTNVYYICQFSISIASLAF